MFETIHLNYYFGSDRCHIKNKLEGWSRIALKIFDFFLPILILARGFSQFLNFSYKDWHESTMPV